MGIRTRIPRISQLGRPLQPPGRRIWSPFVFLGHASRLVSSGECFLLGRVSQQQQNKIVGLSKKKANLTKYFHEKKNTEIDASPRIWLAQSTHIVNLLSILREFVLVFIYARCIYRFVYQSTTFEDYQFYVSCVYLYYLHISRCFIMFTQQKKLSTVEKQI